MRYQGRCQNIFRINSNAAKLLVGCWLLIATVSVHAEQDEQLAMKLRSLQQDASLHDVVFIGKQFGYVAGDHGLIRKNRRWGSELE